MREIDGSFGEGGGQILRTALSLSCVLNQPFHMFSIRKGRGKPGLMPQHLMCVRALKSISNAQVKGDDKGSMELLFNPSEVRGGDYSFDIGTAGSTSLLLQAILPPLIFAQRKSTISLRGGTHVPFSPTFDYIREVFIPSIEKLGISVRAKIGRYGFYPKGGGEITVEILPSGELKEAGFLERGGLKRLQGISGVGNLPSGIAERQRDAARKVLEAHGFSGSIETFSAPGPGQGTFLFLKAVTDHALAGFSSLGERGKRAESVGEETANRFLDYESSKACLDPHLADQIVLYLSMAKGSSSLSTSCISRHLLTNLWVIKNFTGRSYFLEGEIGSPGRVTFKKEIGN